MAMPPALARWHKRHKRSKRSRRSKSSSSSRPKKTRRRRAAAVGVTITMPKHKKTTKKKHGSRAETMLRRFIPTTPEAVSIATAALYGRLEGDAAKDANHFLKTVPTPLTVVGRSGNIGIGMWILGAALRQPLIRAAATGVVDVAAYQLMRRSSEYTKDDQEFKLSGSGSNGRAVDAARLVDQYLSDDDE